MLNYDEVFRITKVVAHGCDTVRVLNDGRVLPSGLPAFQCACLPDVVAAVFASMGYTWWAVGSGRTRMIVLSKTFERSYA